MNGKKQGITRDGRSLKRTSIAQKKSGENKNIAHLLHTPASEEKQAKGSKGDIRYWQSAVKKVNSPDYSIQLSHLGKRHRFPLGTPIKEAAGKKAQAIYQTLKANGWEFTLAKFKPHLTKAAKGSSVGDLIKAVSELANVRPTTLRGYLAAFRRIVADVRGIEATAGRYARCGEDRDAWLTEVDAVPLASLSPDLIEAWKLNYVKSRAGANESKARHSRNSADSFLRMAKGLFAKPVLALIQSRVILPSPLPFDGVRLFPKQSMRYDSTLNIEGLLIAARDNLAVQDPEAFKAFAFCLFGGLRRNEADKLRWSSIDFEAGFIHIETQEDFAPKAETSLGKIPIDSVLCEILKGLRTKEPKTEYVLATDAPKRKFKASRPQVHTPALTLRYNKYRAQDTFTRLAKWLRLNGVNSRTPLHTLRKEAGSLICAEHGLFAASRFLRHAEIAITAKHYADQKNRVTVGLGEMAKLKTERFNE